MSVLSVLVPVFVHVALCFALLFGLIGMRRLGEASATVQPSRATRFAAAYANQFEMPVLFYGLVPLALLTHKADAIFVALEWVFVAGRLGQAAVHVTTNYVPLRGTLFFVSFMALGMAWIKLALDLVASST